MPLFGRKKKESMDKKVFREEIEQLKQTIEPKKPMPEAPEKVESTYSAVQKLMQTIREGPKEEFEKKVAKLESAELPEIPSPFGLEQTVPVLQPKPEIEPVETEQAVQSVPLFVKIDRYRQILNAMNYLKSMLVMVKNNFIVLNELEKLRNENMKLVQDTIDKIDKKLKSLDSEFLRPSGFIEQMPELHDVQGLQATITDLRSQVDQLKADLQHMS